MMKPCRTFNYNLHFHSDLSVLMLRKQKLQDSSRNQRLRKPQRWAIAMPACCWVFLVIFLQNTLVSFSPIPQSSLGVRGISAYFLIFKALNGLKQQVCDQRKDDRSLQLLEQNLIFVSCCVGCTDLKRICWGLWEEGLTVNPHSNISNFLFFLRFVRYEYAGTAVSQVFRP